MKFTKIKNVKAPIRANATDAGIDFFVPEDQGTISLTPGDSCLIPSGIKVNVPEGYALIAFNKSGVATKKGLQVGACVVDCGYQGEIHIHLVNVGQEFAQLNPGDKVVQFVLIKLGDPVIQQVSEDDLYEKESNRGEGGFGSTGTK
jgi:dUTP pyrophosphatase|tara:strand:- start:2188 stop:2625 length:438 start_codon:yes stop_codon:yes gene_type:complete